MLVLGIILIVIGALLAYFGRSHAEPVAFWGGVIIFGGGVVLFVIAILATSGAHVDESSYGKALAVARAALSGARGD